jgi:hypothetical protein
MRDTPLETKVLAGCTSCGLSAFELRPRPTEG